MPRIQNKPMIAARIRSILVLLIDQPCTTLASSMLLVVAHRRPDEAANCLLARCCGASVSGEGAGDPAREGTVPSAAPPAAGAAERGGERESEQSERRGRRGACADLTAAAARPVGGRTGTGGVRAGIRRRHGRETRRERERRDGSA